MIRMLRKTLVLVLVVLLLTMAEQVYAAKNNDTIVKKLVSPFVDVVAVLLALAFGLGILGFIFLLMQGALKWTIGGGFGRSMAVQTFIRAAEVLAIIPVIFFVAVVLQNIGDPHLTQVAQIYTSLVNRGWQIIISALS